MKSYMNNKAIGMRVMKINIYSDEDEVLTL